MKRPIIIVIVLAVLVLGGVAAAMQVNKNTDSSMTGMDMNDAQSSDMADMGEQDLTDQTEVTMDIKDFDFQKPNIKIKTGTKVTWTNADGARHDVVPDGEGPEGFGSELLAKGESYSFTFTEPGVINYLCEPHPYMKGVINVIE